MDKTRIRRTPRDYLANILDRGVHFDIITTELAETIKNCNDECIQSSELNITNKL